MSISTLSKKELRQHIRNLKARHSASELGNMSMRAIRNLVKDKSFIQAQKVLIYYPLADEVDTTDLLKEWNRKKTFLLPKVNKDVLTIHPYDGPESLQEGAFHIMEPSTLEINNYEDIDLIVVPGIAFSHEGHRLGRGKGYYDKLLNRNELKYKEKIGLAFSFQLYPKIVYENHDVMMNKVITN